MFDLFKIPKLTYPRMAFALVVAVVMDAIQIGLGPLGVVFIDEIGDFFAMALISLAIGFHPLLLPTFLIELVPLVDMLPTWTGCTMAVLLLRKRAESASPNAPASYPGPEPPPMKQATVIDDHKIDPRP